MMVIFDLVGSEKGFVAVGANGAIACSPDGLSWSKASDSVGGTIYCVACGNGTFVTLGDSGQVRASSNGRDWTRKNILAHFPFEEIAIGDGKFIGVSYDGNIAVSHAISLDIHQVGNQFFLHQGEAATNTVIEVSSDFTNWQEFKTFPSGTLNVDLPIPAGSEKQFFRGNSKN